MPYKHENFNIPKKHDKRVKLTPESKADIIASHKAGASIRSLALLYGVSRRLIQFTIYPERLELNKQLRAERGGSAIYYNRHLTTEYMRVYRAHKQRLYIKGELIPR